MALDAGYEYGSPAILTVYGMYQHDWFFVVGGLFVAAIKWLSNRTDR